MVNVAGRTLQCREMVWAVVKRWKCTWGLLVGDEENILSTLEEELACPDAQLSSTEFTLISITIHEHFVSRKLISAVQCTIWKLLQQWCARWIRGKQNERLDVTWFLMPLYKLFPLSGMPFPSSPPVLFLSIFSSTARPTLQLLHKVFPDFPF